MRVHSHSFVVVLADSLPFGFDSGIDVRFADIKRGGSPGFICIPEETFNFGVFLLHAAPQCIEGDLTMFLLSLLDFLEDGSDVELEVTNERHFEDKSPHKVIENFVSFFLEMNSFVCGEFFESLVVEHG